MQISPYGSEEKMYTTDVDTKHILNSYLKQLYVERDPYAPSNNKQKYFLK